MRITIAVSTLPLLFSLLIPPAPRAAQDADAVEAKIKTLLVDPRSQTPVVVLETVAEKQLLPIWIDVAEARAIAMELEHIGPPRPLTHDLIRNLLRALGATLQRVTITEIKNGTYYAILSLRFQRQDLQIDSRPSDAIAVALRMKAPIYASRRVLAQAQPVPGSGDQPESLQKRLRFQGQNLTTELASLLNAPDARGVLVSDVEAGGPAMAAGLQRGDVITRANGTKIDNVTDLEAFLLRQKPPARIRFEVIKKGKPTLIVVDLPS
ncbi:MAG TPA: bifunctional nuclease domain-containing protein [candidate division Zixibacteria bacterium]|nr:bifunctional nuclease domain-containing protein [candidate division Zixibacteria bacterium]